jgi:hypothetical protein
MIIQPLGQQDSATQLVLESNWTTVWEDPVIESVVLTIPYFVQSADANGDRTFELDSVWSR